MVEHRTRAAFNYLFRLKYIRIFRKFRDYTMISQTAYCNNLEISNRFLAVPGAIVECGTWKGGMIAGIASIAGKDRKYYLFDSFQGLPPARQIDGESALAWQSNTGSNQYFDNCTASEVEARAAMQRAGIQDAAIIRGWFKDSLPNVKITNGIAILRMDADWYDSTLDILNHLFNQVNPGGVIIIDDYYTWDGCSRAVHDYLSRHSCKEKIRVYHGVCYLVKE